MERGEKFEEDDASEERDFGVDCKLLFEAIQITGEKYGLGMPVLFLCGSVS